MLKYIIEGKQALSGTISPSGNKNEALPVLAACLLTEEVVTLYRVPKIQDILTLCKILTHLGVELHWETDETLVVCAKNLKSSKPDPKLCSYIRASILLMGPLLARRGDLELAPPGGDVIGARRIDSHFEGMESLGVHFNFENQIKASAKNLSGQEIFLDEPSVTATENLIMLATAAEGTTIIHNAACEPHVRGLCLMLNKLGAQISGLGSNRLEIKGGSSLKGGEHTISPDFMEVGSFLCLGAISRGKIKIEKIEPKDLRFTLKTLARIGIFPEIGSDFLAIDGTQELVMQRDITGRIATVYSGPWPAYPTDLMSVAIVAATQAKGTMIFHEKMFEGRLFFTDKLMAMGANIVLCDPHRVVITGPANLKAAHMSSPDVRAGMALAMAAVIAEGKSEIHNVYQIERGYYRLDSKLNMLGAKIKRVDA